MSSFTGPAGVHSKEPESPFSVQLQKATVLVLSQVYLAPQRSRLKSQPVIYSTPTVPALVGGTCGKLHPRAEKISALNKKIEISYSSVLSLITCGYLLTAELRQEGTKVYD